MKTVSIILAVLLGTFAAAAQEGAGLRGLVYVGGRPAASATVTVTGPEGGDEKVTKTSVTDENGSYYVGFEMPGNYRVTAWLEKNGRRFEFKATDPIFLKFAFETKLNIELVEVPSIRASVTVAAGREQSVEQVSKTVDVIGSQEMRDRADFSLVESLRTIPGFRIAQSGGFGRVATIKTRGLRNQDTAVLLDGIRFRDPSAIAGDASPFLSDFTLTSIDKIEVFRGSGSSLYGTNAIGGVIDIVTPSSRAGTHGQIAGAFGGLGLGRFRGTISHGLESGKFGVNAGLSRTVYTKGIDGDDNAYNTNFQSRFDAAPFTKTNISGRFFFSDAKVRLNVSPDTFGPLPSSTSTIISAIEGVNFIADQNDPDSLQASRFYNGQFVVTQVISDSLVIQGHYSGIKTNRRNTNGVLGPGYQPYGGSESYLFGGQIHTFNGHLNWNSKYNQLTAGYEYESEKFENEGSFATEADNFLTGASQSSNTFYVQDLLSFIEGRLQLSGAFRAQGFSLKTPTFSSVNFPNRFKNAVSPPASFTGDASVSYFFAQSGTKLRAHVGNGYRVPSLYERFGSYYFFNSFFGLGNPELKPERSIAFDGGVEQNAFGERVKLSAAYFYTKINDEITYLPTDDLGAASYFNFDKHFSRGLEFSARLRPRKSTEVFATYTFTNSDIRNFRRPGGLPTANVPSTDRASFGIPLHQFTIVATQRYKRFWVNFDFLATSDHLAQIFSNSTFSNYIYRFKGNRKGDLTAGYTFRLSKETRTLRLYGTIENVFDQEYYENGFRTAGVTGRVGLTFGF